MRSIQIFRSGVHRPMSGDALSFSDADLAACAAAYDPALHEAPIVIGHPATDDPAWGWVKSLTFADGALVAEADQINPAFAEQVKAGSYKKVSAAFWRPDAAGNPTPGKWALRHVGFLGAKPPAVKGLAPVAFAGGSDGVLCFGMEESWAWGSLKRLFQGLRDRMIEKDGLDAADRALPVYEIDALSSAQTAEREEALAEGGGDPEALASIGFADTGAATNIPRKEQEVTEKTTPSAADLAAREASLAEREKLLVQRERAAADAANAAFADELINEGRLVPAQKDTVAKLLGTLSEAPVVAFADGEKAPGEVFKDFLKALPQQVDFAERAKSEGVAEFADTHELVDQARALIAKAKAEGRTLSEVDAVSQLTKGR